MTYLKHLKCILITIKTKWPLFCQTLLFSSKIYRTQIILFWFDNLFFYATHFIYTFCDVPHATFPLSKKKHLIMYTTLIFQQF